MQGKIYGVILEINNTKQSHFVGPRFHNVMRHVKNTEDQVPIYNHFSPKLGVFFWFLFGVFCGLFSLLFCFFNTDRLVATDLVKMQMRSKI